MNVRFDSDSIRVRMRLQELHELSVEGALCGRFPLPQGGRMEWNLLLTDREEPELAQTGTVFELRAPRREILSLRTKAETALGKKKELSVRLEISGVPVVLDVDYFEVSRRRSAHG